MPQGRNTADPPTRQADGSLQQRRDGACHWSAHAVAVQQRPVYQGASTDTPLFHARRLCRAFKERSIR